jgi:RNA polymerase sigma-70 factor (ECF subfamily)
LGRDLKQLVREAADGDGKAMRELIESVQGRLYKFCLVLCGDAVKAEDLCQEALIKTMDSLKKLKEPAAFIDWLFRLTRNIYIDDVRKKREESVENEELDSRPAETPEITEVLAVNRVLSHFEPEDRVLLVLVDMENYSYSDAAAHLGITEAAVRSRLFRIRKEFVEKWNERETK